MSLIQRTRRSLWAVLSRLASVFLRPAVVWLERERLIVAEEGREAQKRALIHRLQSCGPGLRLNGDILITEPESVCIGNNVHIGDNAFFSTAGGLTIGDNTHISRNVTIYTVNHRYQGTVLPYDDDEEPDPVLIGKNVWVGMNVNIVPGVSIGDGAVIGMGALVTKDVPALSVVGGSPAVVIKERDKQHYKRLEAERAYGGINGSPLTQTAIAEHSTGGDDLDGRLFFGVTTGRSGSLSLTDLLSRQESITCLHEPRLQLIRLSTELAHGSKSVETVRRELAAIYKNSSVYPAGLYGEVDQKFWNLIPSLDELFPGCRFIWLVRDGRDVVTSMYNRGWFSKAEQSIARYKSNDIGSRWQRYRLNGFLCGDFEEAEWAAMSQFERCCWYWGRVNRGIARSLEDIAEDRQRVIVLERVEEGLARLSDFLGISTLRGGMRRVNTTDEWSDHYRDKGLLRQLDRRDWSQAQRVAFDTHCGDVMDRFYHGWRNG